MIRVIISTLAAVFGAAILTDILLIIGRRNDPFHDDYDVSKEMERWEEVHSQKIKERSKRP